MEGIEYFDSIEQSRDEFSSEFYRDDIRELAFLAAGVKKGKTAADIGAGTGFITEGLLRNGVKVIAVDISNEILEVLARKFGSLADVELRAGAAENLPIESESVDYAFANMFIHHTDSPPHVIREMARILKPGGCLVIIDLDEHHFEFLRDEHNDKWMGFDRNEVKSWIAQAGLEDVRVECTGAACCSSPGSISIFIAHGTKPGAKKPELKSWHWSEF